MLTQTADYQRDVNDPVSTCSAYLYPATIQFKSTACILRRSVSIHLLSLFSSTEPPVTTSRMKQFIRPSRGLLGCDAFH